MPTIPKLQPSLLQQFPYAVQEWFRQVQAYVVGTATASADPGVSGDAGIITLSYGGTPKAGGLVIVDGIGGATVPYFFPSTATPTAVESAGYTVTHGVTFSDTNHLIILTLSSGGAPGAARMITNFARTTTTFGALISDDSGAAVRPADFSYLCYGTTV